MPDTHRFSMGQWRMVIAALIVTPAIALCVSPDLGQVVVVLTAVIAVVLAVTMAPIEQPPSVPLAEINSVALTFLEEMAASVGQNGLDYEVAYARSSCWATTDKGRRLVYLGASKLGPDVLENGNVSAANLLFSGAHEIAHHALGHTHTSLWRPVAWTAFLMVLAAALPDHVWSYVLYIALLVALPVRFVCWRRRCEYAADALATEMLVEFLHHHPDMYPDTSPELSVVVTAALTLNGTLDNRPWHLHPATHRRLARIHNLANAQAAPESRTRTPELTVRIDGHRVI